MLYIKRILTLLLIFLVTTTLFAQRYGKNKVQQQRINWSVIESRHFDIHFVTGQDDFGRISALIAENAFYHLNEFFQQPLGNRIPIVVYSTKQEFQATNIIYPLLTEGIGGFTETMRNRVVLPFDGSYKKFEEVFIHELVHAYINDIDNVMFRNPFLGGFSRYLPFWFSEGLPEYLALDGVSVYNNMFIIDMVINSWIPDIEYLGGYFAYRLGEVILLWIVENWDKAKLVEYFYNLRFHNDLTTATQRTFGMEFRDLQAMFRLYLNRKYSNLINEYKMPWEVAIRQTNVRESNAQQNIFPRWSSCGEEFVFFSSNRGRTVIKKGSIHKQFKDEIVLIGERTHRFEEFHFQSNNIARFPNDNKIAFVSKTSFGDVIYVYDIINKSIINELPFKQFDSIYEIDVCPNGVFLAITAQKRGQCDIYIYNLLNKELTQITNDRYFASSPNWSPDGIKLAYVAERDKDLNNESHTIFGQLVKNIFYYDKTTKNIYRVTDDSFNNYYPIWANNEAIMFITERDLVANIDIVNTITREREKVTNILSGIHSFDYSPISETLIFSCYFNNAWELYTMNYRKQTAEVGKKTEDTREIFVDDFFERFNLNEYRFHGREPHVKTARIEYKPQLRTLLREDSLKINFFQHIAGGFTLLDRPDRYNYHTPTIRSYRPLFHLDSFWGGMAYSTTGGAAGMLHFGMSDVLGDHGIGVNVEFNEKWEDTNFVISYLYLPHRIDYGLALFNYSDHLHYRGIRNGIPTIFQESLYQSGGYLLTRYPINRFFRLDFENTIYYNRRKWSYWSSPLLDWIEIPNSHESHYLYVPRFGYVFDNALYGKTGPMAGSKLTSWIRHGFGSNDNQFTTLYSDFRHYTLLPSNRYAFANRLVVGMSEGNNPERFHLMGFNGVRGYFGREAGNRIVMTSLEFRYPMIDQLRMSFPIPLHISNLRGSLWTDIGAVWNNTNFRGTLDGKLNDIKMSFGFGPRFNLGIFILKIDVAWQTDLMRTGRPVVYLTINEEF